MQRRQWRLVSVLLIATFLLTLLMVSVTLAAPPPQQPAQPEDAGQEYMVQAGDWLSTISQEFLGSSSAYMRIVEATNAKAANDPRFARIDDPDVIEVGQRLWIPAPPADPTVAPSSTVTATATATNSATNAVMDSMTITATSTATIEETSMMTPAVRFVTPVDRAVVTSPVAVEMAAQGITIEPAGEIRDNAGHFHILIDTDFVAPGELIPFDDHHRHFGQGQLTTTLELDPGIHTLRLQAANGAHLALEGDAYRDTITVTVQPGD